MYFTCSTATTAPTRAPEAMPASTDSRMLPVKKFTTMEQKHAMSIWASRAMLNTPTRLHMAQPSAASKMGVVERRVELTMEAMYALFMPEPLLPQSWPFSSW